MSGAISSVQGKKPRREISGAEFTLALGNLVKQTNKPQQNKQKPKTQTLNFTIAGIIKFLRHLSAFL